MAFFSWYLLLETRDLFLWCDSGGQVGGPLLEGLTSNSPASVSDILALVAPSKIFATSLLGTCQIGFYFFGSLNLSM